MMITSVMPVEIWNDCSRTRSVISRRATSRTGIASRNRSASVGRSITSLTTFRPGLRSSSTEPEATSRPPLMIATASQSRSTSSNWCEGEDDGHAGCG